MEFVAERGGVTYIDDSKGTNVASVVEALASVRAPIILIAGGMDKGGDYGPLRGPLGEKVRRLILIGAARDTMRAALEGATEIELVQTLGEAVRRAAAAASRGDPCCSPASRVSIRFKTMRSAGEYFRSWFGRFESVARSQLGPLAVSAGGGAGGARPADGAQHHLLPRPREDR
jgi:UDP-N-acetylmuramoylalanine--D-glutamate ligase